MNVTLNNLTTPGHPASHACIHYRTWCNESFRSAIYTSAIVAIIFNIFTAFTAVLGNGLVFVAYYQYESLRRPANTILLSLAVTDFLTGAVSQPLFIYEKILMLTNCTARICSLQNLRNVFMLGLSGGTLVNLSLSTLDRYVAVFHSFRYLEIVTNSRVKNVLLASWLAVVGIAAAGLLSLKLWLSAVILLPSNVIVISILYYRIFKKIRRLEANPVVAANETEEARKARERKSAETVGIILGLLFVCYIPVILVWLFFITEHIVLRIRIKDTVLLDQQLIYIGLSVASSNSTLNVFVYFWKNSEIRSAMLKIVRPITQRFTRNEVNPA